MATFLSGVRRAIREVLQRHSWGYAFDGVGFGAAQGRLERFVLRGVGLTAPPVLPADRPSNAQISQCFDRRYRVDHAGLWRVLVRPAVAIRLAFAAPAPSVPHDGKMLPHRLRSEARAAAATAPARMAHPPRGVGVGRVAVAKATL